MTETSPTGEAVFFDHVPENLVELVHRYSDILVVPAIHTMTDTLNQIVHGHSDNYKGIQRQNNMRWKTLLSKLDRGYSNQQLQDMYEMFSLDQHALTKTPYIIANQPSEKQIRDIERHVRNDREQPWTIKTYNHFLKKTPVKQRLGAELANFTYNKTREIFAQRFPHSDLHSKRMIVIAHPYEKAAFEELYNADIPSNTAVQQMKSA